MIYSSDPNIFITKNYRELVHCVLYILKRQSTDDELSEIISGFYLRVLKKHDLLNKFNPNKSSLQTLIFTSLKNHIYTYRKKSAPLVPLSETLEVESLPIDALIDLKNFVAGVTGICSSILSHMIDGTEVKVISEAVGTTVQGVHYHINKIKARWEKTQQDKFKTI